MQSQVWRKAIETCADPQRARHYLDQLKTTPASGFLKKANAEQARVIAALFSGSQALSELLIQNPDWAASSLEINLLKNPRQHQGFRREVDGWLRPCLESRDYAAAFRRLREFKQREMLRIAARDLARLGDGMEVTREISDLADVILESVYQLCRAQLESRLGAPYHQDPEGRWQPTEFCVLGMGKLGGQELNYSSDVDVLFVYSEEGHVFKEAPRGSSSAGKGMTNHQFFIRLAESFIGEVGRMTPEGMLYRIDLRLRPEGNAGPLARSLGSYENYYAQWGQTWERMMLIKARRVAGDVSLASEFLETIQPFRYPRSLGERILKEIAAMKLRIESEVVKAGEIDRNVKLGRGGIREIEFLVQSMQLLRGGRSPFLQEARTLPALDRLVKYGHLTPSDGRTLAEAYVFFRNVEHRLQMENNLQTHTIPTERRARERLAALMGFETLQAFEEARQRHADGVRALYEKFLQSDAPAGSGPSLPPFQGGEAEWAALLASHSFRDPAKAVRLLQEFVHGPGYVHVSPRTEELARELLPRFLQLCPNQEGPRGPKVLSDPDRVLARLDSFVSAYGARAMLYELWTANPSLFELLLLLFDRSEFLAEIAIRTPDLVDELELSGRLRRVKTAAETLADLRHGREDEDQRLWLRRYHQAELMRIGLRDILGLADFEQNHVELSALADACLQYALEVVLRKRKLKEPPFAIIGLGKLGGAELNYGSDLDIIFVADSDAGTQQLPQLQRMAAEVMELLSSQTELGVAFPTDARLRPDGEKGLLANTLRAHEDYYRHRAQLWEIQSLTRARPIAGNSEIGAAFHRLAGVLTNFKEPTSPLAAYTPGWKAEVDKMRRRIEKERTPPGKQQLAIKTGSGGLMDAEFIAQALCLSQGWQEPNTLRALIRGWESGVLPEGEALIDNYRKLRRIEGILRRWSFEGETLLPDDPAPLYRVAVRCGFSGSDDFMRAVAGYRAELRRVYQLFMEQPASSSARLSINPG